ncbi:MAG TPA: hypothetical protein VF937_10375 [Chloroflexota bacterium]
MPNNPLDRRTHTANADATHLAQRTNDVDDSDSSSSAFQVPEWIQVLAGGWKILVLGGLIAGAVAAITLLLQPKQYVAEALVAPIFSSTQVQFEPRIRTVDSATEQTNGTLTPERRQALLDLVKTGEIESSVIRQISGTALNTPSQPGQLVGRVRGEQRPKSEMISIQAEADTPDDAVAITNAWAQGFVDLVNRVYGSNSVPSLDKLKGQRDDALAQYQQNQAALADALQTNKQDALNRQISDREHQIAVLQSPYQSGAFGQPSTVTSANNRQSSSSTTNNNNTTTNDPNSNNVSANQAPPPVQVDAQTARGDYRLTEVRTLDGLAENLRRLDVSKQNLRVLMARAQSGQSSAADEAAIAVLKTQLVSMTNDLPQLQLQVTVDGNSNTAAELQQLNDSIDQARAQVAAEFDARRAAFEASSASQIASLEDEVRSLKSQSEAAATELKQLTLRRDLSWDTYTALARKVDEQTVAQSSSDQQVEIASRASVGVPSTPRFIIIVPAAAAAGVLIAALILLVPLVQAYLGPYVERRRRDERALVPR